MDSKDLWLHFEQDLSLDQKVKENLDLIHSDIINTLNYKDIISHFGTKEEALKNYRETLSLGFPRTAAFLMGKIIKGRSIGVA
jgi:hypothetical protein